MTHYQPRITQKDRQRYVELQQVENALHAQGFHHIAGVDEAGRGPLAGPVVTAACILDPQIAILGLNDSKKLSEKKRTYLAEEIKQKALAWQISAISAEKIDAINILEATKKSMTEAVRQLSLTPDMVLIDAVHLPELTYPQRALIGGDARVNAIAAASILAKTERDQMMREYAEMYPAYHFEKNKGYGTKEHYRAIAEQGLCPIHRLTFLKKLQAGQSQDGGSRHKGFAAEARVADHLREQGFTILERNFLLPPFGEIDLIARRQDILYVVEVKARRTASPDEVAEAITPQKIAKMRLLADYYAQSRGYDGLTIMLLGACCQLDQQDQVRHIHFYTID